MATTPKETPAVIGGTSAFLTDSERRELDEACKRLSGRLLTPRLGNGLRIGIVLSESDARTASGRGDHDIRGIVTDLNSGKRFLIQGADCGLKSCVCDAVATPVTEKRAGAA